jgi:hypothetical protein
MGLLYKTKTYMVGPMQYEEGRSWREDFTKAMNKIGVVTFDPYSKPFVNTIKEDESTKANFLGLMENGDYETVHEKFKEIRRFDLSMVDRSDFITGYINPNTPTFGTMEELVVGCKSSKPTFIFVNGGKRKTPLWLMGMFKHTCFFDSMDAIVETLYLIDNGSLKLDDKYWRLLDEKYR